MSTEQEATGRHKNLSIDGDPGVAEWHPFSVWQKHVKNGAAAGAGESSDSGGGTGSWNAFQVWQRLIK